MRCNLLEFCPEASGPRTLKKINFHPAVRQMKIGECAKTHYFGQQKTLSPPTVRPKMQKSINFDAFYKTNVFSCAFHHTAFFHMFASTLRSESRFDCRVEASKNFPLYRFSLHQPLSSFPLPFSLWGLIAECVQTSAPTLFLKTPPFGIWI